VQHASGATYIQPAISYKEILLKRNDLCLDELAGHTGERSPARVAQTTEEADQGLIGSRESGDVVGLVVGVGARECLASGQRLVAVLGEDHLDALGIGRVDDGRDIKVVRAGETVPTNFSQHARDVVGAIIV